MQALTQSRPLLWLILSLPGVWILGNWALTPQTYGYGHAIGDTGDWAAWLLMVTLAVTPARLLFRKAGWAIWLMRRRRDLGVASFTYAALHTIIYVWNKAALMPVLDEATNADMLAGWLALALFIPLAVTSNDKSVRAMKRAWKKLHRLVYPAAVLMFVHWVLASFDPTTAWIHIGIMAAIEIVRIALQQRQSVT